MKKTKKLLALLLALCMVVSLSCTTAFAGDEDVEDEAAASYTSDTSNSNDDAAPGGDVTSDNAVEDVEDKGDDEFIGDEEGAESKDDEEYAESEDDKSSEDEEVAESEEDEEDVEPSEDAGIMPLADDEPTGVAAIGRQGYETLKAAIDAVYFTESKTATVTLLGDVEGDVSIYNDCDITLDLNSKTINGTIWNFGDLTIEGDGEINGEYYAVFSNGGEGAKSLTINSGSFSAGAIAVYSYNGVNAVTINGGTFTAGTHAAFQTYTTNSDDVVTINDGTFLSTTENGNSDVSITGGIATISGGTFSADASGIAAILLENVTATISGGTYTATDNPALNASNNCVVSVTGGKFVGSTGAVLEQNGGKVTIIGGTFSSDVSDYCPDGTEAVEKDGTWSIAPAEGSVAAIGNVGYPTLQAAIDAAKDGDTVVLLADVDVNTVIEVKKSITIEGNSRKVNSTASRILRVEESGVTVNLKGIEFASNTAERGVQVDVGLSGVKLNIDNCKVLAKYAVQVCGSAEAELNISSSTIQGYAAIQVWSKSAITVEDSTLIGYNTSTGGSNGFSAIVFNGDGSSDSSGSTLTVTNSTVKTVATDTVNALEKVLSVQGNNPGNITATFTGCTFEAKQLVDGAEQDTDLYMFYGSNGIAEGNRVTIDGTTYAITAAMWEKKTDDAVAEVDDVRYFFLQEAIKAAQDGETVTLLADIVLERGEEIKNNKGQVTGYEPSVTIDKAITIDGNGFTLSRKSDDVAGSFDTYHRNAAGNAAELYRTFDTTGTINFNMFNVADNASLTLKGVKVDDGVRWTVDEAYELLTCTGPLAKQSLIKLGKNAKLDLTGCEITGIHADCTGAVITAMNSEASVTTIADTSITGCVSGSDGLAYRVGTTAGATVTLKSGAKVDGNYNYNTFNHAIFMIYNANTMTMEDGSSVSGNFYHGNGVIGLYSDATFTMNGGQLNDNRFASYIGGYAANLKHNNNSHGPVVYIHLRSTFIMNGGEIKNNLVHFGAIMDQSTNPTVILNGGEISGNGADENKNEVFRNAQLYLNVASANHWTMSKNVKIVGDIILDDGTLTSEFEVDAQVRPTVNYKDKVVVKTANDDGTWTYTLGEPAEGEVPVALDRETASLYIGNTVTLNASTNPENAVVIWTSSDESVATVDANGVVTGVAAGTATITAKVGNATATCAVTVTAAPTPSSSGGTTTTTPPTVEIEDPDVPLAGGAELNKADHIAYISGYADGTVRPDNYLTREEVATIFYRLLTDQSRAVYETGENSFSDVDAERWSNTAISTLANAGIITGYADGTFRPANSVTRAELAAMAARFDDVTDGADNPFSDTEGHWAKDLISFVASKGWVNGYADGTFRPDAPITRAEAMKLINQVLGRQVDAEGLPENVRQWPDNDAGKWYYTVVLEATTTHGYERRSDDSITEIWVELNDTTPVENDET